MSSLATAARTALASIASSIGEMSVAVVIDGVSGTGLRVSEMQTTDFGEMGETGLTTATVRVSGATFERPARGQNIRVDGQDAVVTQVDGSGILWVIQYRVKRSVTEP